MAGPKGSKYYDIFLNYQVWLERKNHNGHLNDDLIDLLRSIDRKGSLKAAAEERDLSYRKAWGDIRDAEEFLQLKLVKTVRGGKDGGLTQLTELGQELVTSFKELHHEFDKAIYRIIRNFFARLNQNDVNSPE